MLESRKHTVKEESQVEFFAKFGAKSWDHCSGTKEPTEQQNILSESLLLKKDAGIKPGDTIAFILSEKTNKTYQPIMTTRKFVVVANDDITLRANEVKPPASN